jgi:hypothetical protein
MDNPLSVGHQHASFKVMGYRNCQSSCSQSLPLLLWDKISKKKQQGCFLCNLKTGSKSVPVNKKVTVSHMLDNYLPLIVHMILNLLKTNQKAKRRGGRISMVRLHSPSEDWSESISDPNLVWLPVIPLHWTLRLHMQTTKIWEFQHLLCLFFPSLYLILVSCLWNCK